MGLILDTSILIESERHGEGVEDILRRIRGRLGETDVAISAVTVAELTHGIHRARNEASRLRRTFFARSVFQNVMIYPMTFEIAEIVGRVEAEQAAIGIRLDFEDLVIGATALFMGFEVATLNLRHFQRIPGLKIVEL